jgi:hypothetical protein
MNLSGNMTRQVEQDLPIEDDNSHIINIGRMVEDMELKMRNLLQEVYFGKAKDVVGDLRSEYSYTAHQLCVSLLTIGFRYRPTDRDQSRSGNPARDDFVNEPVVIDQVPHTTA